MTNKDIAKIVHEANRQYCLSIGEHELEWAKATQDIKEWYLSSVEAIIDSPEITAEEIHDAWCSDKTINGWMYGEIQDNDQKIHPCLVPYEDLSDSLKMKDKLMITIVNILKDN